jgi:acetyl-CoA carboxylase biotin carboxyl carrier protein
MDYTEIKSLMKDMESSNLDSLEIELPEGTKVKMRKSPIVYAGMNYDLMENSASQGNKYEQVSNNESTLNNEKEEKVLENNTKEENYKTVKSPMVGTFYTKSSPTAEPFVKVGDKVKKGDILCIIEAMKLMNEIESDIDGEIAEICYKDEDLVEYGSVLFKII